jgi:hypothetical protein
MYFSPSKIVSCIKDIQRCTSAVIHPDKTIFSRVGQVHWTAAIFDSLSSNPRYKNCHSWISFLLLLVGNHCGPRFGRHDICNWRFGAHSYRNSEFRCSLPYSTLKTFHKLPHGRSHYKNDLDQSSWATKLKEVWLESAACSSLNNDTLSRLSCSKYLWKSYWQPFLCWRRCFGHKKLMHHENNIKESELILE